MASRTYGGARGEKDEHDVRRTGLGIGKDGRSAGE
jgi:hypothetical protein